MKINVLEQSKDKIKVEFKGESATFANLIKKEAWKDDNTDFAAVVKSHPYMKEPELTVKTTKGSPEKVIEKATDSLIDQVKQLKKEASEYVK